jgi:hypothetical protein
MIGAMRPPQPDAQQELRCASCEKPLDPKDAARCAICKREVCPGCLRTYGHHMLACEECRLESW